MNIPLQCWDCLECCGKKDTDKQMTRRVEPKNNLEIKNQGETSLQAQIEINPKK
jgi:hypothetical protein